MHACSYRVNSVLAVAPSLHLMRVLFYIICLLDAEYHTHCVIISRHQLHETINIATCIYLVDVARAVTIQV